MSIVHMKLADPRHADSGGSHAVVVADCVRARQRALHLHRGLCDARHAALEHGRWQRRQPRQRYLIHGDVKVATTVIRCLDKPLRDNVHNALAVLEQIAVRVLQSAVDAPRVDGAEDDRRRIEAHAVEERV